MDLNQVMGIFSLACSDFIQTLKNQMKKHRLLVKIVIGLVGLIFVSLIVLTVAVEPLVLRKIQSAINESSKDFNVKIGKVHLSIFNSGLELETISISAKPEQNNIRDFNGEVASIRIEGVHLLKAIFKNDIEISEVTILNCSLKGRIPFSEKATPPKISPLNIRIDSLFLDKVDLMIKNTRNAQAFLAKDGVLKLYDLEVRKYDTLSAGIVKYFDFNVQEFRTVSPDSMYTQTATGINYSASANLLTADSLSIHPNYGQSDFAARHQFEIDRFDAGFSQLLVHDFSAMEFLKSGSLVSSFIEIGKLEMDIFRDKRKEFSHIKKPTFQELIYNYPDKVKIDSIGISGGKLTYTEHAENASEPGVIRFNKLNVLIFNITNDTIYKTEKAFVGFNAEAFLMGKAKMIVHMKGRL